MIERFSKTEFEYTLTDVLNGVGFKELGLIDREECYSVQVNPFARILVRSSVNETGVAGDTGEDSIRVILEVLTEKGEWKGSKKIGEWTTRVPGWEIRMRDKMRVVWGWAKQIKKTRTHCAKCGQLKGMWMTKGGKRPGSFAEKCFKERNFSEAGFGWMDKAVGSSVPDRAIVIKNNEPEAIKVAVTVAHSGTELGLDRSELDQVDPIKKFTGPVFEKGKIEFPEEEEEEKGEENGVPYTIEIKEIDPTGEQVEFIELPVDANARLLAGPGSGKTLTISLRNVFLIKNGVDPKSILNVTFSAAMAASGMERVVRELEKAVEKGEIDKIGSADMEEFRKRFSTIHAACVRILYDEGLARRIAPKNWMVTKILKDIAEQLWPVPVDRPGPEELEVYIAVVKRMGLTSQEDMAFFGKVRDSNGMPVGEKLHLARKNFDKKMMAKGWWTFADQVFECEQKLSKDRRFREKWQARFKIVCIDEGQDVNAQAMRILATLSLEPGDNRIYHDWDPVKELKK